jgi:hypothetical protein
MAVAIRREVDERFDGDLSKAAEAAGLSTSTLKRLAAGRSKRITTPTLRGLHTLLPRNQDQWGSFVYDGQSLLRIRDYHRWQILTSGYLSGRLPISGFDASHQGYDHNHLTRDRVILLNRIATTSPEVATGLLALSQSGRYFIGRIEVAALRIIEPLCQAVSSGQVERKHDELSDDEFRRFVKAGFDRELILLDRDSDVGRLQHLADLKTDEPREPRGVARALLDLIDGQHSIAQTTTPTDTASPLVRLAKTRLSP